MSVHREKYLDYDGPLEPNGGWWTIAAQTVKSTAGYLRTKLIVPLLWIPPLITALLIIAQFVFQEQAMQSKPPSGSGIATFLQMQFYSLAVLYAVSCSRVVSHDIRYKALELYFSKPLEQWEYAAGKLLGLVLVGGVVTVGPAVALGGLRIVLYSQKGLTGAVAADVGIGIGLSLAMTIASAAVMLGLSTLTRRTGFVVLAWVGAIFVPLVAGQIVSLSTDATSLANVVSIQGSLGDLAAALYGLGPEPPSFWIGVLGLMAWTAAGISLHVWRLRQFEDVL